MKKQPFFKSAGIALILCACVSFAGCSKDGGGGGGGDVTSKTIGGLVQKGPFVTGTSVQVQELDNRLNPTGTSFETQINDDFGSFTLSSKIASGYIEIVADGQYFNEILNEVTDARIRLRNIAKVAENQTVNINILTTLQTPRLRKLVADGVSFDNAVVQSRKEVLKAFNITADAQAFDRMSIVGAGADNAILLAVSAIMQQGRNAGELTELVAKVANDISDNGTLDTQSLKSAILASSSSVDPIEVRRNLIERYKSLGHSGVEVPDFYDYLDSNGDGNLNGSTPYLRLEDDYYEVDAAAQSIEILLATNCNLLLDIPFGNNWLRKDIQKSTASKLVLSIDQNTVLKDRSVVLTLRTSDNAVSETVTVYQRLEGLKFAIELQVGAGSRSTRASGAPDYGEPLIENLDNLTILCFDQSGKLLFKNRDNAPVYENDSYLFAVATLSGATLPLTGNTLYCIANCPYDYSTFTGTLSQFLEQDLSLDLNGTDVELLMSGSVKLDIAAGVENTAKCTMEHPISKVEAEITFAGDVPTQDRTIHSVTFKNALLTSKGSIFSKTKTGYSSGNYTPVAVDGKYSFYCYQNSVINEIEVQTSGGKKTVAVSFTGQPSITCTANVIYRFQIQINQDAPVTCNVVAIANETGKEDNIIELQ